MSNNSFNFGQSLVKEAGIGSAIWEGSKFLPGVGALPSFVDAGRAALRGDWSTAALEGGMGALSFIPGGAVARGAGALGRLGAKSLGMAGKAGLAGGEALGKLGVRGAEALGKVAPKAMNALQNSGGLIGAAAKDIGNFAGKGRAGAPGIPGAVNNVGRQVSNFAQKIPGMASRTGNAVTSFAKDIPNASRTGLGSAFNYAGGAVSRVAPTFGKSLQSGGQGAANSIINGLPKFGLQYAVNNASNNSRNNFYNSPGYKYNQPRYY